MIVPKQQQEKPLSVTDIIRQQIQMEMSWTLLLCYIYSFSTLNRSEVWSRDVLKQRLFYSKQTYLQADTLRQCVSYAKHAHPYIPGCFFLPFLPNMANLPDS